MTPKEKAVELVEKYRTIIRKSDLYDHLSYRFVYLAKQCALIAVEEILDDDMFDMSEELFVKRIEYWQQVKEQIENL